MNPYIVKLSIVDDEPTLDVSEWGFLQDYIHSFSLFIKSCRSLIYWNVFREWEWSSITHFQITTGNQMALFCIVFIVWLKFLCILVCFHRQYKDKEEENQGGFFSALTSMVWKKPCPRLLIKHQFIKYWSEHYFYVSARIVLIQLLYSKIKEAPVTIHFHCIVFLWHS